MSNNTDLNYQKNIDLGLLRMINQHKIETTITKLQQSIQNAEKRNSHDTTQLTPHIVRIYISHSKRRLQEFMEIPTNITDKERYVKIKLFKDRINRRESLEQQNQKYIKILRNNEYHDVS